MSLNGTAHTKNNNTKSVTFSNRSDFDPVPIVFTIEKKPIEHPRFHKGFMVLRISRPYQSQK